MAEVQAQPATAATQDVDPVRSVLPGSSGSQSSDSPSGADAPGSEVRPVHEEFWNLPNTITMFRIGVVPILLFLPLTLSEPASAAIAWFFIVAAVTDIIDGWLARRGQQVTHIGKLPSHPTYCPLSPQPVDPSEAGHPVSQGQITRPPSFPAIWSKKERH